MVSLYIVVATQIYSSTAVLPSVFSSTIAVLFGRVSVSPYVMYVSRDVKMMSLKTQATLGTGLPDAVQVKLRSCSEVGVPSSTSNTAGETVGSMDALLKMGCYSSTTMCQYWDDC